MVRARARCGAKARAGAAGFRACGAALGLGWDLDWVWGGALGYAVGGVAVRRGGARRTP
mgnify:CR=1